jgi:endonuclease-8
VQRLWRSIRSSRKPVGLVLMTQEMVAGLGNIYRAEVLFKVRTP